MTEPLIPAAPPIVPPIAPVSVLPAAIPVAAVPSQPKGSLLPFVFIALALGLIAYKFLSDGENNVTPKPNA